MGCSDDELRKENERLNRQNIMLHRKNVDLGNPANRSARDGVAGTAMSAVAIYFTELLASGSAAWPSTLTAENFETLGIGR